MKNPATYLRKAMFTALNGAVTYSGNPVPIYENEGDSSATYQVIIRDYSDADSSNKRTFVSSATQVIEMVARQNDSTRKAVDEIGAIVGGILQPSRQSTGIADSTDFELMIKGKPSINYLMEDAGSGVKIVRLLFRYSLLITEK
jgi:hypothetical protein